MFTSTKKFLLFSKFPVIELNELYYLRQPKIEDAKLWLKYLKHKDVACYVPDPCIPKDISSAEQEMQWYINVYKKKQGVSWAIAEKSTNNIIGTISFEKWSEYHRRCEIAYDLNPDYWGQGIMYIALNKCVEVAFNKLGVVRIEAYTTVCNERSINLLLKSNFYHEALLKKHRWFKNQQIDVKLFTKLADD